MFYLCKTKINDNYIKNKIIKFMLMTKNVLIKKCKKINTKYKKVLQC